MANKKKKEQAAAELYRLAEATALLRMYREAYGHEPVSVQTVHEWAKRQPGPIEPTDADINEASRTHPELVAQAHSN